MTLRDAKKALKAQYKEVPGVFGFGIGDGQLWVYVLASLDTSRLPSVFEGYDVIQIGGVPVIQAAGT